MTKKRRWAGLAPVLACFLFGVLAALGHAPFNLPIFTVIGLAAAGHLILTAGTPRQAGLRAWVMGIGYFAVTLSWLVEPFMVDIARHGWMAPFALFLMSAGLSFLWGVAAGGAHLIAKPPFRRVLPAVALAAAELVRARLFTGFPWGNPGHVWIDTPVAQLAYYVGASGLGALTFLVAFGLASALPAQPARHRLGRLVLCSLIVAAGYFAGAGLQSKPMPSDKDVVLRLVQPNAPQHLKWDPAHAYEFVARQVEFTAAAAQNDQQKPDLIIWPETAIPTLLEWADDVLADVADAANETPVLFGVQRGDRPRYFNSLALLGADGQLQATYDKHHLVPFGEYIPLGDFLNQFGIGAFAAQTGNGYSPGPGPRVLDVGVAGKILPLICYEAVFPRDIRAAPERADWILHATNDAWFGEFSMPYQHLAQARFRAIEFGLPVIRVANTGISAVIDVHGNVRASIALGKAGFLDAELPGASLPTPYSRHGDLPLIVLVSVVISAFAFRRGLKAR